MEHITDSIVAFPEYAEDGSLEVMYCSGFFIDEKHIITARHCLLDIPELEVMKNIIGYNDNTKIIFDTYIKEKINNIGLIPILKHTKGIEIDFEENSKKDKTIKTKLVYMNINTLHKYPDYNDIAILEVLNKKDYSKHWLKFASKQSFVNDDIISISFINQNPWYLTNGRISKIHYEYDKHGNIKHENIIVGNMTTLPGASGSPLLNSEGDVIGITSYVQYYKTGQVVDFGFFVSSYYIANFYKEVR